jgi:hypothetical protein
VIDRPLDLFQLGLIHRRLPSSNVGRPLAVPGNDGKNSRKCLSWRSVCAEGTSWPVNGCTAMSLPEEISLKAANTVDGGQIVSIRPTLSRHSALMWRASSAQSTYRSVSSAAGIRSTLCARNSGTSV